MIDTVTIVGNVATDPVRSETPGGIPVTNFRLASTQRRFDGASQKWVDGSTNWYSIAAFRQLGEHAKASLQTGDSVIVTGKLKIRAWENNGKQGTSVDIDAETIGHDLRWGTSTYARVPRNSVPPSASHSPTEASGADREQENAATTDQPPSMALGEDTWTAPTTDTWIVPPVSQPDNESVPF